MSKTCKNCDHRRTCNHIIIEEIGKEGCVDWSGWHDAKDPPKESDTYIVYGKWDSGKEMTGECEFGVEDGYFHAPWNFNIIAWRELPEYEVEK